MMRSAGREKLPEPRDQKAEFTSDSEFRETRKPLNQARTLDPRAYHSADFFAKERKKVFEHAWVPVGLACMLKNSGDTITVNLAGQAIFIIQNPDGCLRAFHNICRHRGSKLVLKDGNYRSICCPYHRWTYNLDGDLKSTPMWNSTCPARTSLESEDMNLFPVRVGAWGAFVYCTFSESAPELETYLGEVTEDLREYPLDSLRLFQSGTYRIKANWKLLAENFMEYYHLPSVHPELCEVSGVSEHQRVHGKGSYVGLKTSPLTPGGTAIDPAVLPPMPGLSEKNRHTAWFHLHFPNMAYFLFPHSLFCIFMEPTAPDQTTEHAFLLLHPGSASAPDYEKKMLKMWEFYDLTNRQDIEACEQVQEVIHSAPYQGGKLIPQFEEPVHKFQNMIIDYMTGKPEISF